MNQSQQKESAFANNLPSVDHQIIPRLIPLREAAVQLGTSTRTLKRLMESQASFPKTIRMGGKFFFVEQELAYYIDQLRTRRDHGTVDAWLERKRLQLTAARLKQPALNDTASGL